MTRSCMMISAAAVVAVLAPAALAQDEAAAPQAPTHGMLGDLTYGGTGCPQGSVAWVRSPDGQAMAVLFDSYTAETGGEDGSPFARASCGLAIPVAVPDGMRVSIFPVDLGGSFVLDEGATATVTVEHFFAGATGPMLESTIEGPVSEDRYFLSPTDDRDAIWSGCGEDVILRTNAAIVVIGSADAAALATFDAAVGHKLMWESCSIEE